MEPSLPVARAVADEQGTLVADVPCRKCGYNLRGLSENTRCPECGVPVGLSLRGDLLRFADPDWVRQVARGLTIMLWMIPLWILAGLIGAGLSLWSPVIMNVVMLAAGIVSFYGAWLMTEPDPSRVGEDANITARKVIRFSLVVGLLSQPVQMVQELAIASELVLLALGALAIAATLIGLVGEFAKFIYYERLARRIPDDKLASRARFLRWAWTITLLVMVAAGAVWALLMAAGGSGSAGAAIAAACVFPLAGVVFVVFALMTVRLMLRLRKALVEQADLARATWAAEFQPQAQSG